MKGGLKRAVYANGWTPDRTRDAAISALWPTHSTRAIGVAIGLSGQRVAQIAKRLYREGVLQPRPSYWRSAAHNAQVGQ